MANFSQAAGPQSQTYAKAFACNYKLQRQFYISSDLSKIECKNINLLNDFSMNQLDLEPNGQQ